MVFNLVMLNCLISQKKHLLLSMIQLLGFPLPLPPPLPPPAPPLGPPLAPPQSLLFADSVSPISSFPLFLPPPMAGPAPKPGLAPAPPAQITFPLIMQHNKVLLKLTRE